MNAELYQSAVALVRETNKASTSHLQRSLGLGYCAAAEMMDRMENELIVSTMGSNGHRDVYPIELSEMKSKLEKALSNVVLSETNIDEALSLGSSSVQDIFNHVQDVIISKALVLTRGNSTKAAELLGWNRGTFAKRKNRLR